PPVPHWGDFFVLVWSSFLFENFKYAADRRDSIGLIHTSAAQLIEHFVPKQHLCVVVQCSLVELVVFGNVVHHARFFSSQSKMSDSRYLTCLPTRIRFGPLPRWFHW